MVSERFQQSLCFDDVLIKPRYSEIMSRKDIDTKVDFGKGVELSIPIISSPMDTVTEHEMASKMASLGGLGIIHRYNSPDEQAALVKKAVSGTGRNVGFAVGVGDDMLERTRKCLSAGAKVICVDIAHGHHALMRQALTSLRNTFGWDVHIMAGNVATLEGFDALSEWGADSIRIGIGGGSICSTRVQTGHGMPTLQSVMECSASEHDTILIADGGIRNSGDIVKCLAAGADAVMVGSLLAGAAESPGKVELVGHERLKVYRGMASKDAQIDWRGHYASVEGVTSYIKPQGPVREIVSGLERGIRSGLSYSGCTSIHEFQHRAQFVRQSALGQRESSTHIYDRGQK